MTKETYKARCGDCLNLKVRDGSNTWVCKACFNQKCSEIDECPEGIEVQEIEQLNKAAKAVKVRHEARAVEGNKRATRERKPDPQKEGLIKMLAKALTAQKECSNVKITNPTKIVEFDIDDNHYKLDLIHQRKPKVHN